MTIMELGALGEFVGAIAVVVTLGYLALQIRQSNRIGRANAATQLHDGFQGLLTCFLHDAELAATVRKGFWDWDALSKDEQAQLHAYWASLLAHAQLAGELAQQGLIDEGFYRGWEDNALSAVATPGLSKWWAQHRAALPEWLTERIDSRLADPESLPLLFYERFPFWQRDP